jgi:hypothetical protein
VVYLTLSMQFAVRALSLLLIVWLTAAASFPPCCWSMASANDHQAPEHASAPSAQPHQHHHPDSSDVVVPSSEAPLMSAIPAHSCETEPVEALAPTRTLLPFAGLLAAGAASADIVTLQVPATLDERSDSVPPGGSPGSAFLSPLRI